MTNDRVHSVLRQLQGLKFEDFLKVSQVLGFQDPTDLHEKVVAGIQDNPKKGRS